MFNPGTLYVIMALTTFVYLFAFKDSDYKLPISRELLYIVVMSCLWPVWLYLKFGDK